MDQTATIILQGGPLSLGEVGLSVYTRRLIRLLRSIVADQQIKILIPETVVDFESEFPESFFVQVPGKNLPGGAFLNHLYWQYRIGCSVQTNFAQSLFLSPGPYVGPLPRKSLIVMHDVIYRSFPRYEGRYFIRKWSNRWAEWNAARCHQVVTVSPFAKSQLIQQAHLPEAKIQVIHNWIEDRFIRMGQTIEPSDLRFKYQLPRRFWLYLGGYDYRKNVEFLLKAYAVACQTAPCPPLVLAGAIPTDVRKPVCRVKETIQQLGLSSQQVLLPGVIPEADLAGVYAVADLLIFPSLMEGFGYTPAEALAVGTPALVSKIASLSEIVRDPQCHFDPTNLDTLIPLLQEWSDKTKPKGIALPSEFTESEARKAWTNLLNEYL